MYDFLQIKYALAEIASNEKSSLKIDWALKWIYFYCCR